jgi:hypothetical protein
MKRALSAAAGLSLIAVAFVGAAPANAAPITCPGGQSAEKTGPGEWDCVNNGGNDTGAGRHKGTGDRV